jgi:TolA-binding protein
MRGALPAAALLGVAVSTGCATNNGAIEEELSRLRREVRALNQKIAEDDLKLERLEGRVTLLALGQSGEVAPAPKTEPTPKVEPKIQQLTGPERALPVVKLSSAGEEDGAIDQGAVDDGSPPIVIKLSGDETGDDLPVDHGVLAKPDPVLGAPEKPASAAEIKAAYEIALAKLRIDQDPAAARALLARFSKRYPKSEYADNVAYWLAECDFAEGRYEAAVKSFQKMIDAHPRSAKVPDAKARQAEAAKKAGGR